MNITLGLHCLTHLEFMTLVKEVLCQYKFHQDRDKANECYSCDYMRALIPVMACGEKETPAHWTVIVSLRPEGDVHIPLFIHMLGFKSDTDNVQNVIIIKICSQSYIEAVSYHRTTLS